MKQSGAFDGPIYLDNISANDPTSDRSSISRRKRPPALCCAPPSRERRKYSTIWNPASLTGPWHLRPARHDYSHWSRLAGGEVPTPAGPERRCQVPGASRRTSPTRPSAYLRRRTATS